MTPGSFVVVVAVGANCPGASRRAADGDAVAPQAQTSCKPARGAFEAVVSLLAAALVKEADFAWQTYRRQSRCSAWKRTSGGSTFDRLGPEKGALIARGLRRRVATARPQGHDTHALRQRGAGQVFLTRRHDPGVDRLAPNERRTATKSHLSRVGEAPGGARTESAAQRYHPGRLYSAAAGYRRSSMTRSSPCTSSPATTAPAQ